MSATVSIFSRTDRRARFSEPGQDRTFILRAETIAKIAGENAADVDAKSRFPAEAFAALREQKLLGMLIPAELGGEGARAADVADVCAILGAACASTAMIFAMHQVKLACLIRHHRNNEWQLEFLRRAAEKQLLLASSTTEGMNGGNIRSSEAAIQLDGPKVRLTRDASCISYGAEADAIVTTARRGDSAANSDQVLVVFEKETYTLEPTKSWDTLGMRGTCSVGYMLRAEGVADQVMAEPYDRIHTQTMAPYAHLFWSSAWCGVATGAFATARAFVRNASRNSGGKMPPGSNHLTKSRVSLETLRAAVQAGLANFERNAREPGGLTAMDAQLALNFLKVEASELAVETVSHAMRACGLSGYRNDTDYSLGRTLRDILSAPIMIHNERILASAEASVLMSAPPSALSR
ncbi:MAG: acyl-CoA/acyl-ACP dehydrogenase [Pseudomonadota bacterium]|nr:acyl-CoA/acyl-ACP dehydrogenase [Pseudomonadota bacterium]